MNDHERFAATLEILEVPGTVIGLCKNLPMMGEGGPSMLCSELVAHSDSPRHRHDLAALRDRDDFRELLAGLETRRNATRGRQTGR